MTQIFCNLHEAECQAQAVMDPMFYDYYRGGADDEITVESNTNAFRDIRLQPRILRGAASPSMAITVLGQQFASPIAIAPTALQKLAHPDGELAMARAAGAANHLMILSTTSSYPLEEVMQVAKISNTVIWFQLYVFKDREASRELVQRAEQSGCKALVLTADTPVLGRRERDIRNGFHLPPHIQAANYSTIKAESVAAHEGASGLAQHFFMNIDAALTWNDVEWLCSITSLPIVIKGVLHPDDARLAAESGARGIIVSNHGGRQLDTAVSPIRVVSRIAEHVEASNVEVLMDGGIRRGTDVLKALALGARMVCIGRPALWGLALQGQQGVENILSCLRQELSTAMSLSGCQNLSDISEDLIFRS